MNRNVRFLLSAFLVLLFSSSSFAQKFEGAITMEITSAKLQQPMTMVIATKGERSTMTMQLPTGNMKLYFDQEAEKMTMVMGTMGMETDLKKAKEKVKEKTKNVSETKVVATGEKKVINGHTCELYRVTGKDSSQSNWWMTDDLPKSLLNSLHSIYNNSGKASMAGKTHGPGAEVIAEMFKKGLVPIKFETLKDGNVETTMTFVSYEQKHLDDSEFMIPKDVIIRPMPDMSGMGKD
jgi:hypothetical protein